MINDVAVVCTAQHTPMKVYGIGLVSKKQHWDKIKYLMLVFFLLCSLFT